MSETNTQDDVREEEEIQMTPEEYAQARTQAMLHLKKEIVFLKVEKEYETLLADVEEAKTRRITMIAQQARFFSQNNPNDSEKQPPAPPTPTEPSKPRKLKTD